MATPPSILHKAKVFLSYARKDMAFAEKLHAALEAAGYDVLLDRTDIAAGEDWQARLAKLIIEADTVVFCVSPASSTSTVCAWEISEAERQGKRILPVVAKVTAVSAIPAALARLNFIFFAGRRFDTALGSLLTALQQDLPWLREHTRLGELALQWQAKGEAGAGILRGRALEEAELWLSHPPRDAAIATDVQRHFIIASRQAAGRRQRNWIAGILAVLALSIGLTVWSEINRREAVAQRAIAEEQTRLAEQRLKEADEQRAEAVRQKDRAEKAVNDATGAANEMVTDLAQKFRDVRGVPIATVRSVLDRARELQVKLINRGETLPDLARGANVSLLELTDTLLLQGDTKGALDVARVAVAQSQKLSSRNLENVTWQSDVAAGQERLGSVLEAMGDWAGAEKSYRAAHEVNTMLSEREPGDSRRKLAMSYTWIRLGDVMVAQGKYEDALLHFQKAFEIRNSVAARNPGNEYVQKLLSGSHGSIGDVHIALGQLDEAIEQYRTALEIDKSIVGANSQDADFLYGLIVSHHRLGDALSTKRDSAAAQEIFQAALAMAQDLYNSDTENTRWKRGLQVSHGRLGRHFLENDERGQASKHLLQAIDIGQDLLAMDPGNADWQRDLVVSHWALADAGSMPRENYVKALNLLAGLKTQGKMAPEDERHINYLATRISMLPLTQP